jgi:DNA-binding transcriptional regulator YhcF (GntR family)
MRSDKDGSGLLTVNLNEEIRKLKDEGASLRKIAATLHLSHETIRKRLKNLEGKDHVSTKGGEQEFTTSANGKEKISTGSNVHKSRASKKIKDTINQLSTLKTPSVSLHKSVNISGIVSCKLPDCKKGVFQEVVSEVDSLSEEIKQFLESKGIEIYRMHVSQEAYQMKHRGQIIRFYVQRNKEEME